MCDSPAHKGGDQALRRRAQLTSALPPPVPTWVPGEARIRTGCCAASARVERLDEGRLAVAT
jgi:hypothetical protein